jgi:hypothetical protein
MESGGSGLTLLRREAIKVPFDERYQFFRRFVQPLFPLHALTIVYRNPAYNSLHATGTGIPASARNDRA